MANKKTGSLSRMSKIDNKVMLLFTLTFGLVGGVALHDIYAAPLKGSTKQSVTPTISIATVNGSSYDVAAKTPVPKLGDTLTFNTTIPSLAGWEYPMIDTQCYQDVNGDGTVDTNLFGPDIVYTWLDHPTASQVLGGYSSIWTQRGGGAVTCLANLDAYGWKSGKESIRVLATTGTWQALGR